MTNGPLHGYDVAPVRNEPENEEVPESMRGELSNASIFPDLTSPVSSRITIKVRSAGTE